MWSLCRWARDSALAISLLRFRCVESASTSDLFMNEPVVNWCQQKGLAVTRSLAYRKNDLGRAEERHDRIPQDSRILLGSRQILR